MRVKKIKNISWVSLSRPTPAEVKELREHYPQIHPLVIEDLLTPTVRSLVENYDDHLYMVLHIPAFANGGGKVVSREIDIVLMKNILITVTVDDVPIIEEFWRECDGAGAAGLRYGQTPAHLLHYLLRRLFASSLRELDHVQGEIDAIEEKVFGGKEKKTLEDIALLKRNVLDFRRAVKPQQLMLESLATQGVNFYGEEARPFLADLVGEYHKVWNLLENHKETLDALYETNNSLLSARINEVMRVFTILAFISFIPMVITGFFGMNIAGTPLLHFPNAFWVIMALTAVVTGLIFLALKWKKLV